MFGFGQDIGIDLGTATVIAYVKGKGIVLREPSVVAVNNVTNEVLAVGGEARRMLGRTPGSVQAIRPMKDGVIADFEITEVMLDYFLKKVNGKTLFTKPRILICCPSNITQVEKNAIKEAAERTGAKRVYIEEEPKVAATGAGLNISAPSGSMVIDIGGGTTDIAVLSLGGIVTSSSIKIAGNTFDSDIIKYIKEKYKLLIGDRTAEDIKLTIGTVYKGDKNNKMEVRGRNLTTGLPSTITITAPEIEEALKESVNIIVETTKKVLEETPPELSADISDRGIYMTGGGCLIDGLDKLLQERTGINVMVAQDSVSCVALGTGKALDNLDVLDGKKRLKK